ncbi:hypothetical protein BN946_scf184956.g6 [Trametes cinnabarina]|uniref:Fungal-type protein kinase domain-containing protein n=1 Tax=Pycnoporus cinnabarinus TaxID=5643 RepID=A0A060SIQ8_PYCCI|nr:hypothetical protein BN946_scf184956.g6 [Trametes cinnabarina]
MPPTAKAFNRVQNAKSEADIYNPIIEAINSGAPNASSRCPGFQLRNTSNLADKSMGIIGSSKPDIVCYAEEHLPLVQVEGKSLDAVTDMGFAATFIEVKLQTNMDCWADPTEGVDRDEWYLALGHQRVDSLAPSFEEAEEALGQNASYALEICARQHRGFCLSVAISGRHARFIRWDRAGLIISQAFDYVSFPEYLCEFFWRFAHLSDAQRGYDLSVQPATETEGEYFVNALRRHICSQTEGLENQAPLEDALDTHYMANSVTAVSLPRRDGSESRRLLVSRPLTVPLSITGRATRAYWAVEYKPDAVNDVPVVLLKDTWRLHEHYSESEGDIIRELNKARVPNIPSVVCDCDVYRRVFDVRRASGSSNKPETIDNDTDRDGAHAVSRQCMFSDLTYTILLPS